MVFQTIRSQIAFGRSYFESSSSNYNCGDHDQWWHQGDLSGEMLIDLQFNKFVQENVLPDEAIATVNHRIHPAQTIEDMLEVDKRLVNDDRVTFNVKVGTPAAPISPHGPDAFGYQIIKKCINQQFNGTAVVPGLMLASTDTK